jgi:nickel-type superoxide dismutase maturation protease
MAVTGDSMRPALLPGDFVLVSRRSRPRVGRVVVVARPDRPGLLVVKRVTGRRAAGWWVEGDNAGASDDSRVFGAVDDADLVGAVVWRYWPPVRLSRSSS